MTRIAIKLARVTNVTELQERLKSSKKLKKFSSLDRQTEQWLANSALWSLKSFQKPKKNFDAKHINIYVDHVGKPSSCCA